MCYFPEAKLGEGGGCISTEMKMMIIRMLFSINLMFLEDVVTVSYYGQVNV